MARKAKKPKLTELELKIIFNDISLREMGYDLMEDGSDYVCRPDSEELIMIKDKFIKYSEYEFPILSRSETDLNLIDNPKQMEFLFARFIAEYADEHGIEVISITQQRIDKTIGTASIKYKDKTSDEIKTITSNKYINESTRILDLVCKLNKSSHLYDLNLFNIKIKRRK